jgi:hypothetical protein
MWDRPTRKEGLNEEGGTTCHYQVSAEASVPTKTAQYTGSR